MVLEVLPEGDYTHLIFLDGSGHQDYPRPRGEADHIYFAQAGIVIPRAQVEAVAQSVEDLLRTSFPDRDSTSIEVHASEIMVDPNLRSARRRGFWQEQPRERKGTFMAALRQRLLAQQVHCRTLGRVIDKQTYLTKFESHPNWNGHTPEEPAVNVMRFLLKQADRYMGAIGGKGFLIFDVDTLQDAYGALMTEIRRNGHLSFAYGVTPQGEAAFLSNLVGSTFINSRSSRSLQVADVVANYTWRAAEYGQARCIVELRPLWANWHFRGIPFSGLEFYRVAQDVRQRYR